MSTTPPANPDIKRELQDQLLTMSPRAFELFAGEFLVYVGLEKVSVTRFLIKNYLEYHREEDIVQIAPQLWHDLRYYEMMDVLKSADEQIMYYYSRGTKAEK